MAGTTLLAIRLALAAKQARAQASDPGLAAAEPVAIVGLGCRFPGGGESPEGYWRMLAAGVDAITEVPASRWDVDALYDPDPAAPGRMSTRWGGFLDRVDEFDPTYFGIAPREAASMDPQQRLLLEVAWEALEDAGLSSERLAGSPTGVFFAVYNGDYALWRLADPTRIDAYTSLGTSHSIAAGRLSFLLDLQGPSMVVDTACSSSLVAVHLACQSLRTGESRTALAGGVSLILSPEAGISLSKWGFMAPDGRCKTFDARANGFVRGEGCGVVVLKRLSDALGDGDRVLAVIRGTAVNQDGRSSVLTAPSGPAQEAVIRQALATGRVDPAEVTYVEAHGTGTSLGDPIEVEALADVLGRPADGAPCRIGSVKTNVGHLEAAAGVAGLIKTVLALEHELIPPSLHFRSLNPHISLEGTRLEVAAAAVPWPASAGRRFAGVSAFGFGGTNAHVVLEEAPIVPRAAATAGQATRVTADKAATSATAAARPGQLLVITAPAPAALPDQARAYAAFLGREDAPALGDVCFTAATRRHHHAHRLAVAGRTTAEIATALEAFAAGGRPPAVAVDHAPTSARPAPVFVFSGQGPQWWAMGRELLAWPAFREALEACARAIDAHADFRLLDELGADEAASRLDQTAVAQPAIFALQTALAALLRSWGVVPGAVVGHSVGEVAAAHAAGLLSLDDAARIVVHRGRVMQRATGHGRMLAVRASEDEARDEVAAHRGRLTVASFNAPRSIVLSGTPEAVEAAGAACEARGLATRMLPVNYAFHSDQMAALAGDLRAAFGTVRSGAPSVPMVSTVTGAPVAAGACDADYWVRNVTSPVRFAAAIDVLTRAPHDSFVEIAPHAVLAPAIDECLSSAGIAGAVIPVLRRDRSEVTTTLAALGRLFARGLTPAWSEVLAPDARVVALPAYRWQRQRYWIDRPAASGIAAAGAAASVGTTTGAIAGARLESPAIAGTVFEAWLTATSPAFVADHQIFDTVLMPATGFIAMVLDAASRAAGGPAGELIDVTFTAALPLGPDARRVQTILDPPAGADTRFRIVSLDPATGTWTTHAGGRVSSGVPQAPDMRLEPISSGDARRTDHEAHYGSMTVRGCAFGPAFRGVREIVRAGSDVSAVIEAQGLAADDIEAFAIHPALLDACLQPMIAALDATTDAGGTWVPQAVGRLRMFGRAGGRLRARARVVPDATTPEVARAVVEIIDADGRDIARLDDLRLVRVSRAALLGAAAGPGDDAYCTTEWEAAPLPAAGPAVALAPGRWLILADEGGIGAGLAARLEAAGQASTLIRVTEGLDPLDAGAHARVLADFGRAHGAPRGIVHAWGLDAAFTDGADAARLPYGSAAALLRAAAMVDAEVRAPITFVSAGAFAGPAGSAPPEPARATLVGLARTAALEHPDVRCAIVDLDPERLEGDPEDAVQAIARELAMGGTEPETCWRAGERFVPRLTRLPRPAPGDPVAGSPAGRVRLEPVRRGAIEHLRFVPVAAADPGPGQVEVRIEATGLNFRDVLSALGAYPGDPGPLGDECAGVVTRVGPRVTDLAPGDAVAGLVPGAFATHAIADAALLVRRPSALDAATAAAVPIAFLTAEYALQRVAGLRKGERVLIHAAAGGVGLAAVRIAREIGAEVFATAGSPAKHAHLRALGVKHVYSSRTPDFVEPIRAASGGRGVDVVLNALTGDFIPRSLDVLAPGGRFVEIGRLGTWTPDEVRAVRPDVAYTVVFMGDVFREDPALTRRMLAGLFGRLGRSALAPLPVRRFAFGDAVAAFRHMAQAKHIGKIVVTHQPPGGSAVRADRTYVVTGGLGALGLEAARWLAAQGARAIVLAGRHDPGADARAAVEAIAAGGATVRTARVDVGAPGAADALRQATRDLPPIGGVIHAAGIVDDGVLREQTWDQFARVFAPKASGARAAGRLAAETGDDAFVVLYSSAASLLGSRGQANYAAANAFLGAEAHVLRARGVQAWSIAWGAWDAAGMTAALGERERSRLAARGIRPIGAEAGAAALTRVIAAGTPADVAVLPVDWARYAASEPAARTRPFLARVVPDTAGAAAAGPARGGIDRAVGATLSLADHLASVAPAARRDRLVAYLSSVVRRVLALPDSFALDPHQGLRDVGLDSLMALELKNRLQDAAGRPLSATLAFDHPTVAALAAHLGGLLGPGAATESGTAGTPAAEPASAAADVASLSDEEAEALLAKELSTLDEGGSHGH